ncbi:hypothetical protein [Thermococcus thioreducens]|uniref:Uncharacterized protein n=1 Tax=Thermococcus thioreducens TaxID=277988 RepID=A0A0Q2RFI2_9EURY|nr:hypothetical protein [Thermococcus thioreducens]ASJ12003.1 hypothetical protein A3L14_03480 [Thermococcus thioreducens]KQH82774.1 hypothetical protein AMR53_04085 [Thermococcus thioreducens]SEW10207.1 hypothetical protein SAMN05216170_1579 [Thermococcus thioreducens]
MRKEYLGIIGVLLVLTVLVSGCISSGGNTPTTTTAQNLPFTKDQLESAVAGIKSYEYVMYVKTYNGTKLVATLYSRVSLDREAGMKSSITIANKTGKLAYALYYYTTKAGFVTLTNRSGLIDWQFSCYENGNEPKVNSTLLDNLWKDFPLENTTLTTEGDYYILTVNHTLWSEARNEKDYSGTVTIKLTKNLIPVEILQKAYYRKDNERWVDEIKIEITSVNSTSVKPPQPLVDYLQGQGLDIGELLGKC